VPNLSVNADARETLLPGQRSEKIRAYYSAFSARARVTVALCLNSERFEWHCAQTAA
jgi:hypothetical protein